MVEKRGVVNEAAGVRRRLIYVNVRLAELKDEMKRLNDERAALRDKVDAKGRAKAPKT